ncbi:MAG: polysaccharide pyruvyl transferase family protein [Clostridia bacterium]|nr:polysaccharide pyruvyl transferase family protein [Clostridia bacterium]
MKIFIDAFLEGNLGDDIFVDILLNRYPNHQFYTLSWDYLPTKNLKVFSNKFLIKVIRKLSLKKIVASTCDLSVTIGGSMYMEHEGDSKKSFSLGKQPHYIMGINFGPYKTKEYFDNIHGLFKNAEDVCFREEYSYNLFKDLPNVRCAPDIVFSMDTSNIKVTDRKRVVFSIISCRRKMEEKYTKAYEEKIIEMTKFFIDKGYEVCYMSFCKDEFDEEAIEAILNKCDSNLRKNISTYYYKGNRQEALEQLADSQIIVGGRFHANILGLLFGKTVIPMLYSNKTQNVLDNMNFKGKIIDIRKINELDIKKELTKDMLEYKQNIKYEMEHAEEHFKKLDQVLRK